jgi:hypothetical protein
MLSKYQWMTTITQLAPTFVEAILDGGLRWPKAMQLEELTRAMPSGWGEQRDLLILR